MSPVQLALEVALQELSSLNGLHVTDVPSVEYKCEIDTTDATEIIDKALSLIKTA